MTPQIDDHNIDKGDINAPSGAFLMPSHQQWATWRSVPLWLGPNPKAIKLFSTGRHHRPPLSPQTNDPFHFTSAAPLSRGHPDDRRLR